jgi:hypothetical protein
MELNAVDILLFDPCRTRHRTTRPANPTSSAYRVNIVMTGFEEYATIDRAILLHVR